MVASGLAVLTAVLVGVLAGGMLLIRVLLVPFWRGVPPAEFRRWFAAYSDRIRALMVPLGAGAGVAAGASAAANVVQRRPGASASVVAAGATAGVVAITVTVNEPANHRFAGGALTDSETEELLDRWARWHDVRVVLGLAATLAAAVALARRAA